MTLVSIEMEVHRRGWPRKPLSTALSGAFAVAPLPESTGLQPSQQWPSCMAGMTAQEKIRLIQESQDSDSRGQLCSCVDTRSLQTTANCSRKAGLYLRLLQDVWAMALHESCHHHTHTGRT